MARMGAILNVENPHQPRGQWKRDQRRSRQARGVDATGKGEKVALFASEWGETV